MRTETLKRQPQRSLSVLAAGTALTALTALALGPAGSLAAESLRPAPLLPGESMTRLTRTVAENELGRSLFGDPAGSALVGQIEVFDRYPFVRSRYIQLVTDATWNRILFGEPGGSIHAFDGAGTALGRLQGPSGIDRDPAGRIFVADQLNDRVVVLELRGDGADLRLDAKFAITGLKRPAGVAWDGGSTPLDPADDRLWVADTGNNRIAGYALGPSSATLIGSFGSKGNGAGQFLAPRDVEVGHADGVHTRDLYVADWGNGRVAHLKVDGSTISWIASRNVGADVRTVATDAWGNVYAARRDAGTIAKLDRELGPIFESESDFPGARDLGVGFITVTDHRNGTRAFTGYGSLHVLEAWSATSGASRLALGVEARELATSKAGSGAALHYLLTDHADVDVKVVAANGRIVRHETIGRQAAGRQEWTWDGRDDKGAFVRDGAGFELTARSLYADGGTAYASIGLDGAAAPAAAMAIVGAWPNPANPATQIQFFVPAQTQDLALDIVDAAGRVRRRLAAGGVAPGSHLIEWDGTDQRGSRVASGVYFISLRAGGQSAPSQKLTVIR
jgi:flagellar hook assembly protein FlgD